MYVFPALVLVWILAIDLAALAVGRRIARLAGVDADESLAEALALPTVIGLSTAGLVVFALGALQILYTPLLVVLVTAGAVFGVRDLRTELRRDRPAIPSVLHDSGMWLCAILLAIHALQSFGPRLDLDSAAYHVNLPFTYLRHHALVLRPMNLFANMPHAFELQFALGYAVGDLTGANLIAFQPVILAVVGMRIVMTRIGRPQLGGTLGLLYLASPIVQEFVTGAYVEKLVGCWLLFAFLLLLLWMRAPSTGRFVLFAALVGFLLTTKYTSWLWSGGLVVATAWALVTRVPTWRERIRLATIGTGVAALMFVPWGVKAALATGNPVFPMLYSRLGGSGWSAIQEMQFAGVMKRPALVPPEVVAHPRLTFVWDMLAHAERRFSEPIAWIVALLFFLAPIVAWWWCRRAGPDRRFARDAAILALLGTWSAWIAYVMCPLVTYGRYVAALMAWTVLAIGLAFAPLVTGLRAQLVALLVAVTACVLQMPRPKVDWSAFGREGFTKGIEAFPTYRVMQRMNRELPPDARILFAFESRTWPLEREHDFDAIFQAPTSLRLIEKATTPAEAARMLRARGYTHVSLNAVLIDQVFSSTRWYTLTDETLYPTQQMQREKDLLRATLAQEGRLVWHWGPHWLYELTPPATR